MRSIRDVMTADPTALDANDSVVAAARAMRDQDIGNVLVRRDGAVCGIVTDRDIVVRALANGGDPNSVTLGDVCSADLTTLSPDDSLDDARTVMREKALRRVPVVENGNAVGIVSLGDLAMKDAAGQALEGISEAPPNN